MIEGLKPYAEYKDTGAPWFGKVPKHWYVGRLGAVFCERGETNERYEVTDILSVMKDRGVIPYAEKGRVGNKASDDIGRYKIVRPDDLVMNCMNVIIGSVGRSRFTGCLSPVYYVLKRRKSENAPRFLELVFRHKPFQQSLVRIGNGIMAHRMRIPMEKLKSEMFPLPPPDEQAAIVRFLGHANRKIDGFIRAKRKLIGLLNEQKQAIIHHAVTRGLDPDVPLKPSGIPWLGEIPAHWEVRKLKQCITRIEQGWSPQCDGQPSTSAEWGVLKVGCVNKDSFNADQNKKLPPTLSPDSDLEIRDGDILMSRANTRELLGLAALAENPRRKLILCDKLFRFRPLSRCFIAKFLVLTLRGQLSRAQIESSTNGASSSMQNIGQGVVKGLWVSMPPVGEQISIVASLAESTDPLNTAITRTEREIALMQEYRTRLTADIVTGKLDVRDAAARLPDPPVDAAFDAQLEEIEDEPEETNDANN